MSRVAYVNGLYVPHGQAAVHVEDRGYQFADGVYEMMGVRNGRLIDEEPHLDRLERSLAELEIPRPMSRAALKLVMRELLRRNRVRDGMIYVQMTRGVAPRNHAFPPGCPASVVMTARRTKPVTREQLRAGVSVITIPDIRWKRCDIKTVSLLANVLGKQKALAAGAYEAWQVDAEGFVTEGTATNAWIVTDSGQIVTRHADDAILSGITRRALLGLAKEQRLALVERPFTVEEAKAAREAFITSTTSYIVPVVKIDGAAVGSGKPGPVTRKLQDRYMTYVDGPGATA
jgi:D-alanine transaminase